MYNFVLISLVKLVCSFYEISQPFAVTCKKSWKYMKRASRRSNQSWKLIKKSFRELICCQYLIKFRVEHSCWFFFFLLQTFQHNINFSKQQKYCHIHTQSFSNIMFGMNNNHCTVTCILSLCKKHVISCTNMNILYFIFHCQNQY